MKKSILFFPRLLSLIVFSFLLLQCTKDDTPAKPVSEQILGSWELKAYTFNPAYDYLGTGEKVTDLYAILPACYIDDIYTFKTNGQGVIDEGGSKCDPQDVDTYPFIWTLKDNNKVLYVDFLDEDYNIVQLDNTTGKLSRTFTETGVTYTETLVFMRK